MQDSPSPILEDRPLTPHEESWVRWLLEHGKPGASDFLSQLPRLRVVARCPCGCASVDFAVSGKTPSAAAGMRILSDYYWDGADEHVFGIFVFAHDDQLAGLEVWSTDGLSIPASLPALEQADRLRAWEKSK